MQRKYTVIYLHRSMYEYISVQIFSHDTQKDKKREKLKKKSTLIAEKQQYK